MALCLACSQAIKLGAYVSHAARYTQTTDLGRGEASLDDPQYPQRSPSAGPIAGARSDAWHLGVGRAGAAMGCGCHRADVALILGLLVGSGH
ncbi:MAG TPA: hypothetical protein PLB25_20110 [Rhodoferax sp.]|nr:hypothetical protein [Rhodoferax sp.]